MWHLISTRFSQDTESNFHLMLSPQCRNQIPTWFYKSKKNSHSFTVKWDFLFATIILANWNVLNFPDIDKFSWRRQVFRFWMLSRLRNRYQPTINFFEYNNTYSVRNQLLWDGDSKYQNTKYLHFPTSDLVKCNWPSECKLVRNF